MRPTLRDSRRPKPTQAVPLVDLGATNRALKQVVLERIGQMIDRGDFTNGQAVAEFEQRFAAHSMRRHCVGVASGLDALRLSLIASGLARGARVIVPAMTLSAESSGG